MWDDASTSFFYKLGCAAALTKLGAQLDIPWDQTYQAHRDVESPGTNGPEGGEAERGTSQIWNEHDKMMDQKFLPAYDNLTGV